jgi:predicted metalloprotease with PDZ domain
MLRSNSDGRRIVAARDMKSTALRAACALLALAGCSTWKVGSGTAGSGDVPPADPAEVEYEIALVREPSLSARISLHVRGSPDGETTFALDKGWGGVNDVGSYVHDIEARDAKGSTLAVEHPADHRWSVRHEHGEPLTVSYTLLPNERQSSADPSVHYGPILNAKLLHLIGNLAFLRPQHLDGESPRDIALAWKGFDEAGWKIATSFGVGSPMLRVRASLDSFRQAVFIAGDLRLHTKTIHGRPLSVAIAGDDWGFDDGEFVMLAASIVEAERTFFEDWDVPHYLISLIPVGKKEPGRISLGGTGLTHSFATFMLPGMELKAGSRDALMIQHLLAHEMFHEWNGRVLQRVQPEELVYWFSEGFTDFFARRLMFRAKRLTVDQYAQDIDLSLAQYMLSPARNYPNQRIRDDFWKDRAVTDLPYRRGDVVAMIVDQAMRERSHGERCLDDLMRDLVERGRRGERVDCESLFHAIELATYPDVAAKVKSIVEDGATAELDPFTFQPCLTLRMEPMGPFDLGFDLERSRAEKEVRGVRSGSRAEAAGLRDGSRLYALSVHGDRIDVPVEIDVEQAGERRKIRWLPQGEPVPVPQFAERQGATSGDCARL